MPDRLKVVINNKGDTIRDMTHRLTFCHNVVMQFLGVTMLLPAVNLLVVSPQ